MVPGQGQRGSVRLQMRKLKGEAKPRTARSRGGSLPWAEPALPESASVPALSQGLLRVGQEGAAWGFALLSTCQLEVDAGVLGAGMRRLKLLLPKSRQLQSELPVMDGAWREQVGFSQCACRSVGAFLLRSRPCQRGQGQHGGAWGEVGKKAS